MIKRRIASLLVIVALVMTTVFASTGVAFAKSKGKVKRVKVSKTSVSVQVGSSAAVKVTVETTKKLSKAFKVKNSNAKVAKVSKKGKTITITGKSAGAAKVTVIAKKNKKKKKVIKVTVTAKPTPTPVPDVTFNVKQIRNDTFELSFTKKVNLSYANIKVEEKKFNDGKYKDEIKILDLSSRDGKNYMVSLQEVPKETYTVRFTVTGVNKTPTQREIVACYCKDVYDRSKEQVYTVVQGLNFTAEVDFEYYFGNSKGSYSTTVEGLPEGLSASTEGSKTIMEGNPKSIGIQKAKIIYEDEKGIKDTLNLVFVIGSSDVIQVYSPKKEVYIDPSGSDYYYGSMKFYVSGGSGYYDLEVMSYPAIVGGYNPYYDWGTYWWDFSVVGTGNYEGKVKITDDHNPVITALVTTEVEAKKGFTVTGVVKSKTGKPIPGAEVYAEAIEMVNYDGYLSSLDYTDANGGYTLTLPNGKFTFMANHNSAYDYATNVTIKENTMINMTLDLYEVKLSSDDASISFIEDYEWYGDYGYLFSRDNAIFLKKGTHNINSPIIHSFKTMRLDINVTGDMSKKVDIEITDLNLGNNFIKRVEQNCQNFRFIPDETMNYSLDIWFDKGDQTNIELFDENGQLVDYDYQNNNHAGIYLQLQKDKEYAVIIHTNAIPNSGNIIVHKVTF